MSDKTVRELAEIIGIPLQRLLEQLTEAGLSASRPDDIINEVEKIKLLSHLRKLHGQADKQDAAAPKRITLKRSSVNELKQSSAPSTAAKTVSVEVRKQKTYIKPPQNIQEITNDDITLYGMPGPVTLSGVIADTLGGFLVVRGYAKLSELAAFSFADPDYQRNLKPQHQEDIQKFYQRGEYLFYPEIVLSLELLADYEQPEAPTDDPLRLLLQGQPFKSNVNDVSIKVTQAKTANDLKRVNITVPEKAGKVLKRIDGNHRISAFEALTDVQRLDSKPVSFCVVLLPQGTAKQSEKALFYNINSKALPLTSEEVYKSIIDDESGFADDVLTNDFGAEFLLCRQIRKELNFRYLANLSALFGQLQANDDNRCAVLIEALKNLLNQAMALPDVDGLLTAIQVINNAYADPRLSNSKSIGLFSAFLYFQLQGGALNRQFVQWVLSNHLYELQVIHAFDLIRIFEKVAKSRKQQIFVSMWFNDKTKQNFEAITAAVEDLNKEYRQDIKLRPIRIDQFNTGFSYQINDEILRLINESGYLIADLTGGNKNVYHEIGFLMGLNQGQGLPHENFLLLHNESISKAADDVGFNLSNIKQIRVNDSNNLREQLKQQIAIYYGLTELGD